MPSSPENGEPPVPSARRTGMRARGVVLAAVAAFALAVTGVAVVAARSGGGSGLERLPVAGATATGGERDTLMAHAGSAGGSVDFVVEGTLPDLPDEAPAYRLDDEAPGGAAARIARVLGVDAGKVTVEQAPGAPWYLASAGAPDRATSSAVVASPRPARLPTPVPLTPVADLPSKEEAEAVARRAFGQLGVATDGLQSSGGTYAWDVSVAPKVGGLPTIGYEHSLSVGARGRILGGHGYLGKPDRIGDYPLVGVDAGLDRLRRGDGGTGPRTLSALASGPATKIIGVHLALLHVGDALVPVYAFETDGGGTLPAPAVTDRWLEQRGPERPEPFEEGLGQTSGACSASISAMAVDQGSGGAEGRDDNQPLSVQVCVQPLRAKVGQEVAFEVTATDPDAAITGTGCGTTTSFGDETGAVMAGCRAVCAAPSQFAPKPEPEPGRYSTTYRHAYARPGTYTARFGFGSTMCSPYSSEGEGTADVLVE